MWTGMLLSSETSNDLSTYSVDAQEAHTVRCAATGANSNLRYEHECTDGC
jgi:hypothetical protein